MQKLFDLSGKTAFVTGGGSGIGNAMARGLGLAGAEVILASRQEERLASAAAILQKDGIQARHMACDLTGPEQALDAGCKALELFGSIDILVNAAGVNLRRPFM